VGKSLKLVVPQGQERSTRFSAAGEKQTEAMAAQTEQKAERRVFASLWCVHKWENGRCARC
jgi:hypothetical protein